MEAVSEDFEEVSEVMEAVSEDVEEVSKDMEAVSEVSDDVEAVSEAEVLSIEEESGMFGEFEEEALCQTTTILLQTSQQERI